MNVFIGNVFNGIYWLGGRQENLVNIIKFGKAGVIRATKLDYNWIRQIMVNLANSYI
jgi:hypothetical protein